MQQEQQIKKTHISGIDCPCGGGQSCIVMRRWNNDYVHEDDIYRQAYLPLRLNCMEPYTDAHRLAWKSHMESLGNPDVISFSSN